MFWDWGILSLKSNFLLHLEVLGYFFFLLISHALRTQFCDAKLQQKSHICKHMRENLQNFSFSIFFQPMKGDIFRFMAASLAAWP